MRGHVRKRGDVWAYVVDIEPGVNGLRRQKWVGGFRTRQLAEAALAKTLVRLAAGDYVEPSRLTLGQYLDQWLPTIRSTVRPSTWSSYESLIRLHIAPRLGRVQLRRLDATLLNTFYGELLDQGRLRGPKGLSPRTVRYIHGVLHRALRDAVRRDLLTRNVCDLADPPRLTTPEIKVWSLESLRAFLKHVEGDRLFAAWQLLAATGMRKGEVLGLRWNDVDLEASRLAVRQSLLSIQYELVFSEPKTKRSRRTIVLDPRTVEALRQHRAAQAREAAVWGETWIDSGLVFTREDGSPIHPDAFQRMFERHVRNSGLPRITLHGLRHSHATLALRAGVHPKIVSERLGHATVAFTLDVYSHVIEGIQEEAVAKVAAFLFHDGSEPDSDPG